MTTTVRPFLMFEGKCEAAVTTYVAAVPGGALISLERWGPDGPGPADQVRQAVFTVGGQTLMAMDSPARHAFSFTPSVSLFIEFATEAEQDRTWAVLAEGGEVLMELMDHGFSRRFGWLNDRFGVSWQMNLA